jgi:hypothetical protein
LLTATAVAVLQGVRELVSPGATSGYAKMTMDWTASSENFCISNITEHQSKHI